MLTTLSSLFCPSTTPGNLSSLTLLLYPITLPAPFLRQTYSNYKSEYALPPALLSTPAQVMIQRLNHILPTESMDSLYSDPDGLLRCNLCGAIVGFCSHYSPFTGTPFEAPTYMNPLELPQGPLQPPVFDDLFVDFPEGRPPAPTYTVPVSPPLLYDSNVIMLDEDSTTVTTETVGSHVRDTYTVGDRTMWAEVEPAEVKPQQPPIRRQPPIPGGFPCTVKKCTRAFDRSCDLNRHHKSHLERDQRPHKCELCELRFLYPKDCKRHQQTHNPQLSRRTIFYCTEPGCINVDGFSRRDNLLRHMRNHHR